MVYNNNKNKFYQDSGVAIFLLDVVHSVLCFSSQQVCVPTRIICCNDGWVSSSSASASY